MMLAFSNTPKQKNCMRYSVVSTYTILALDRFTSDYIYTLIYLFSKSCEMKIFHSYGKIILKDLIVTRLSASIITITIVCLRLNPWSSSKNHKRAKNKKRHKNIIIIVTDDNFDTYHFFIIIFIQWFCYLSGSLAVNTFLNDKNVMSKMIYYLPTTVYVVY